MSGQRAHVERDRYVLPQFGPVALLRAALLLDQPIQLAQVKCLLGYVGQIAAVNVVLLPGPLQLANQIAAMLLINPVLRIAHLHEFLQYFRIVRGNASQRFGGRVDRATTTTAAAATGHSGRTRTRRLVAGHARVVVVVLTERHVAVVGVRVQQTGGRVMGAVAVVTGQQQRRTRCLILRVNQRGQLVAIGC